MSGTEPNDDLVEQAIQAMLETPGTDETPAAVVSQVRQAIAARRSGGLVARLAPDTHRDRVSWMALAGVLLLLITCGAILSFHRRLLSEVAGQELAANGARYVFYTDGRVEITRPDPGKR